MTSLSPKLSAPTTPHCWLGTRVLVPTCTPHTGTQSREAERRGGHCVSTWRGLWWHFLRHTPLKSQKAVANTTLTQLTDKQRLWTTGRHKQPGFARPVS